MSQPQFAERLDLPPEVVAALQDPYYAEGLREHFEDLDIPEGMFSISVTSLIQSPRQRVLKQRHIGKLVMDPLANYWNILGHIGHVIIEKWASKHPEDIAEQRMGVIITLANKVKVYVHGQVDLFRKASEMISDYKFTSAYATMHGEKEEHFWQLCFLAWIWNQHGHSVKRIENIYMLKDWQSHEVKEGSEYPKEQIVRKEYKLPDWKEIRAEIGRRALLHWMGEQDEDETLPHCTDQERWMRAPKYKVYKLDDKTGEPQKNAKFTTEIPEEAEAWVEEPDNKFPRMKIGGKATAAPDTTKPFQFIIKELKAKPIRCEYCEIAGFCSQRKAELAALAQSTDRESDPETEE